MYWSFVVEYFNDKIIYEEYYKNGKIHRENGPAITLYDKLGEYIIYKIFIFA